MDTTETRQGAAVAAGEEEQSTSRRALIQALGGGVLAATAGLALSKAASAQTVTDADIFNFALNLEYLEAEFYSLATTGQGLEARGIGVTGTGTPGGVTVKANPQVPFTTPAIRQMAEEFAADEIAHVRFLRQRLGSAAIARPAIDLQNSWNAFAQAAGIGPTFDPFANETNWLLASFTIEDVGVTAYKGAARLIRDKRNLEDAAGILGLEAYHMGGARTRLVDRPEVHSITQMISDLRDTVDGPGDKDQPVVVGGVANIVPTDNNSIVFSRTAGEVLRILYLNATSGPTDRGGFFPNGVNGTIRTSS
jgi:hypothetical protein